MRADGGASLSLFSSATPRSRIAMLYPCPLPGNLTHFSKAAMKALRLLVGVALAAVVAATAPTTGVAARVCFFKDPCSRSRLLTAHPGGVVVDACGKEVTFSPACVARRIPACKIRDPCAAKRGKAGPWVPLPFRGAAVQDGCGRPYRVTAACKLVKISSACYKACVVRPTRVGTRMVVVGSGRPFTCASKCK